MRILADESVDGPVVRWLRNLGHDVEWAAESFAGEADEFLARRARDENLTLITSDRDFGELVFSSRSTSAGRRLAANSGNEQQGVS